MSLAYCKSFYKLQKNDSGMSRKTILYCRSSKSHEVIDNMLSYAILYVLPERKNLLETLVAGAGKVIYSL